jgi:hypothetical protein
MLCYVALVRTDDPEELTSIIRVRRICDTFLRNVGSNKSRTAYHPVKLKVFILFIPIRLESFS